MVSGELDEARISKSEIRNKFEGSKYKCLKVEEWRK
jgi:hypothetical protein